MVTSLLLHFAAEIKEAFDQVAVDEALSRLRLQIRVEGAPELMRDLPNRLDGVVETFLELVQEFV